MSDWYSGYDALLIYMIVVQVVFVVLRLETWRELCVICAFHLIGLALEVFKVHVGSWSYPDTRTVRIARVPMFSRFMYASVGSYICQGQVPGLVPGSVRRTQRL